MHLSDNLEVLIENGQCRLSETIKQFLYSIKTHKLKSDVLFLFLFFLQYGSQPKISYQNQEQQVLVVSFFNYFSLSSKQILQNIF